MAKLGSMWIKICGITSADAVAAAAEAKVDAIGFVFAPSPRQLTPGQAAQLAALAPPGILRFAVMGLRSRPTLGGERHDNHGHTA